MKNSILTRFLPSTRHLSPLGATYLLLSLPLFAGYHLTFYDEFENFNNSRWQTSDFWGMRNNSGDYQDQWFCDPNTAPSGFTAYNPFIPTGSGSLIIQARPTPSGNYSYGLPYVSGQLTTAHKFTQRYGYFELRAKLPPGKGLWSRFWLLTDDGNWPGEYDVFEVLGKENPVTVHQTTHYRDAASSHGIDGITYSGVNPTDSNFHTYGFLWTPETVTWYVDGQKVMSQANRINIPMYTLIDLTVGKDPNNLWPGSPDASTPWPANMELDYFRVYSNDPSLPRVSLPSGTNHSAPPLGSGIAFVETQPTTPQLPVGWTAGDIGPVGVSGSSAWNNISDEWMIKGAGFGVGGWGDQCQFAGTSLSGDGGVVATVRNVTAMNDNDVRAGVMIRETNGDKAREIALLSSTAVNKPTTGNSLVLVSRSATSGLATTLATVPNVGAPVSLRIMRTGNSFTPAYSTDDGQTWTTVGAPQTLAMTSTVRAGLAVAGHSSASSRLSRSTFSNVAVGQSAPVLTASATSALTGQPIQFSASLINQLTGSIAATGNVTWSVASGDGTIDSNGTFTASAMIGTGKALIKATFGSYVVTRQVSITLPSSWKLPNVNNTPPGDAGYTSNSWTLVGGGAGISTTSNVDGFRFLSSTMNGNDTVTVKVTSSNSTQAGLVIRDVTAISDTTVGSRARYAGIWRTPTGLQWATRETAGGNAASRAVNTITTLPVWLRLKRSGTSSDVFTAEYSTNGNVFTQLGSSRIFPMSAPATAGLAVASGNRNSSATATFSSPIVGSIGITPPTVVTAASAGPNPVTGSTTALSVLGADDAGEAALNYTWSATGPAAVTFSINDSNTAKSANATFTKAGSYTLTATITDGNSLTVTSSFNLTVNQTLASIAVTPATATLISGGAQQLAASAFDQFGNAMTAQPAFTWSVVSGAGMIDANGLYTAPFAAGNAVLQAASGTVSNIADVTITNSSPTVATIAGATPNPVTGTTTTLSVLGADDAIEGNLTYTWSATAGSDPVTFSTNSTNSTKSAIATFTKAGSYTLMVTITDAGGLTTTSSVNLTVNQTLTSIAIAPATATVNTGATQQFTASGLDQFGQSVATSPTWSVASGEGSINGSGLYAAPVAVGTGSAVVRALVGSISATGTIAITPSNVPLPSPWVATDINATPTGGAIHSSGMWACAGGGSAGDQWGLSGTGINGSKYSDSFRFVSQQVSGDGTLVMKLIDPGSATQAGLMIRDTTHMSSLYTALIYSTQYAPSGLAWISRSSSGGYTLIHNTSISVPFPVWLKLVRSENTFTAFRSSNGTAWTQIGTQTISLNNSVLVGFAISSGNAFSTATATFSDLSFTPSPNTPPTVATAAAATPASVAGTTTNLSVLGRDNGGEPTLTYTWAATGPAAVDFNRSGSNAAKNATATFTKAGNYIITATVTDNTGLTTTSAANVTVNETQNSITVAPSPASIVSGGTQQFTATSFDQFGNAMTIQPAFTLSVVSGAGTIDANGLYTAPFAAGSTVLQAASGTVSNTAAVAITNSGPTVATIAGATPNPVPGTTTTLSVLGADDANEGNLTYTWSATAGSDPVTFSTNSTNSSKSAIATFTKAGSYTLIATITDAGGLTTTSSFNLTVNQTLASIAIAPATATVNTGATQQFTASGLDQFGQSVATSPTWSVTSGEGSINGSGLYAAPVAVGSGSAVVRAMVGSISASGTIAITPSNVPLPSPWVATDVNATPTGGTIHSSGMWACAGGGSAGDQWGLSGTGINGSKYSDSFRFVNQQVSGDGTLVVKLIDPGSAAQTGLMIRDTTHKSSRFTGIFHTTQYAPTGLAWLSRSQFTYTSLHNTSVVVTFPVWLRLVRSGNTFTASRSSNGTTWTPIGTQTLSLNSTALVGFVVSSGSDFTTATATFSDLSYTPAGSTASAIATTGTIFAPNRVLTPYDSWIRQFSNLTTNDQSNDADPDRDGVCNLLEFAFSGVPDNAANRGYQVTAIEDTNANGQQEFTLTLAVRNAAGPPIFSPGTGGVQTAVVDGIQYTIQGSASLIFPSGAVSETPAPTGLPPLSTGYEYRRFRLNASEGLSGQGFLRVQVEPNP